jgi:hypothetical protein
MAIQSYALSNRGFSRVLAPLYAYLRGTGAGVNGSIPAVTGLSVVDGGASTFRHTKLNFANVAFAMQDQPGVVAYRGLKVYDFPEGSIKIFGATANLVLTKSSTGIIATWAGLFSMGSVVASNNATLTATEADVIPSTITPAAVAGVSSAKGRNAADIVPFDGTATALDLYLNFLVNDSDHDVTTTPANIIVNGSIHLHWVNLGDY